MTWPSATAHLAWHECRRICRPGRLLVMLGPVAVFSFLSLRHPWAEHYRVVGSLTLIGSMWLSEAIPLVAGIAAGSLAEDIRRGVTLTILARGLSRGQYLLAKGIATAVSSSLIIMAGIVIFFVLAWWKLPAGNSTFDFVPYFPGPDPALFQESPLANDLLTLAMTMAAAAALSLVGLLAGTLVANEYIAMVTPMAVSLLGIFVVDRFAHRLSPSTYLCVGDGYAPLFAESQRPYAAFVYWLAFGAVTAALTRWFFVRKELI